MRILAFLVLIALSLASAARAEDTVRLTSAIQKLADDYLASRGAAEHISGVSISLSLPGGAAPVNVVAGKVSLDAGADPVTPDTLFQIGSITKSMTAATLLQLQSEGRLSLDDPLSKHLPEYPGWKEVTLRQLLTMTSGIPGYDATDTMSADLGRYGQTRFYTPATLVGFVDPAYPGAPAPTQGYDYSNTNYILAGMVISRVTGRPVGEEFHARFLGERYGLTDMHYAEGPYPDALVSRMASGYNWQTDPSIPARFHGQDFRAQDMSWAGAAGALVATPEQIARWARTLYQSDAMTPSARDQMLTVVSMKTGKTIRAIG
jgi:D-alanyl-D-alanine carboxypeptidase